MKLLEAVEQHWPVTFLQYVTSNLDDPVGTHAYEVPVERRMMELAKRKAIRNVRFSPFLVTYYVRGVEELTVPQATNRALGLVPLSARRTRSRNERW